VPVLASNGFSSIFDEHVILSSARLRPAVILDSNRLTSANHCANRGVAADPAAPANLDCKALFKSNGPAGINVHT
jgi:hypothetical protein